MRRGNATASKNGGCCRLCPWLNVCLQWTRTRSSSLHFQTNQMGLTLEPSHLPLLVQLCDGRLARSMNISHCDDCIATGRRSAERSASICVLLLSPMAGRRPSSVLQRMHVATLLMLDVALKQSESIQQEPPPARHEMTFYRSAKDNKPTLTILSQTRDKHFSMC